MFKGLGNLGKHRIDDRQDERPAGQDAGLNERMNLTGPRPFTVRPYQRHASNGVAARSRPSEGSNPAVLGDEQSGGRPRPKRLGQRDSRSNQHSGPQANSLYLIRSQLASEMDFGTSRMDGFIVPQLTGGNG